MDDACRRQAGGRRAFCVEKQEKRREPYHIMKGLIWSGQTQKSNYLGGDYRGHSYAVHVAVFSCKPGADLSAGH